LMSDPPGELVWLDGRPLTAPGPDGSPQQQRTNFRAGGIAPGRHVIEIKGNPLLQEVRYEFEVVPHTAPPIMLSLPRRDPGSVPVAEVDSALSPSATARLDPPVRRERRPSGTKRAGEEDFGLPVAERPRQAPSTVSPPPPPPPPPPVEKPRPERAVEPEDDFAMPVGEARRRRVNAASNAAPGECFMTLNTKPWSQVLVDGLDIGKTTPLADYKVACGPHQLTFRRKDLGIEQRFNVRVVEGEPFKRVFTLRDE